MNIARTTDFLESGRYHFCLAMPKTHPLSVKEIISYDDLHGECFLMQVRGNGPINDGIRDNIEKGHPEITIVDVPRHYDLEVFNRCAEEGFILLSLDTWREVHPSLVSVSFPVDETIPYGILSSSEASPETLQFLEIIRSPNQVIDMKLDEIHVGVVVNTYHRGDHCYCETDISTVRNCLS